MTMLSHCTEMNGINLAVYITGHLYWYIYIEVIENTILSITYKGLNFSSFSPFIYSDTNNLSPPPEGSCEYLQ